MGVVERTLGRICPHIDSLNAAIPDLIAEGCFSGVLRTTSVSEEDEKRHV